MTRDSSRLASIEKRFPHLVDRPVRGGRSFRSPGGREIFRISSGGSQLTLPLPRRVLDDLFGGLPFPVESRNESSVIPLEEVADPELIYRLIEALEEQGPGKAVPAGEVARAPVAVRRAPRSTVAARALVVGFGILLLLFLAVSWTLAHRGLDQDKKRSIETLLRR